MESKDEIKVNRLLNQIPEEINELDQESLQKWKTLAEIRELNKRFYQKPIQILQITIPLLILGLTWILKGGAIKEYLDVERIRLDRNRLELANERDSLQNETKIRTESLHEKESQLAQAEDSLELKIQLLTKTENDINKEKQSLANVKKQIVSEKRELILARTEYELERKDLDEKLANYYQEVKTDSIALSRLLLGLSQDYEKKLASTDSLKKVQVTLTGGTQALQERKALSNALYNYSTESISFIRAKLKKEDYSFNQLLPYKNEVIRSLDEVNSGFFQSLHSELEGLLSERRINKSWGANLTLFLKKMNEFVESKTEIESIKVASIEG